MVSVEWNAERDREWFKAHPDRWSYHRLVGDDELNEGPDGSGRHGWRPGDVVHVVSLPGGRSIHRCPGYETDLPTDPGHGCVHNGCRARHGECPSREVVEAGHEGVKRSK